MSCRSKDNMLQGDGYPCPEGRGANKQDNGSSV